MPEISVVMSVYNGSVYLKQAVESILNQTFTDFEFIIIDDGSTDNSLSIIKSYRDSRIKILTQENTGLAKALNLGFFSKILFSCQNGCRRYFFCLRNGCGLSMIFEMQSRIHICGTWAVVVDRAKTLHIPQN